MNRPTVPQLMQELASLWPMYEALKAENAALKAELKAAEEKQGFCFACGNPITEPCEVTKLKAELAAAQKDADCWREYQAKRKRLLDAGFGKSPLRGEAK